jgi:hypothetical protein
MITRVRIRARAIVAASSVQLEKDDWNDLCDDAISELWQTIVTKNPDFRVNTKTFTIASVALNSYDLAANAADFNAVRSLCRDLGLPSEQYLNKVGPRNGSTGWDRGYRLEGSALYIEPREQAIGSYTLKYTPQPPLLTAETGTAGSLDVELAQHLKFIVAHMAVAAIGSEEGDTTAQQKKLDAATLAVVSWASNQRSADADTVEDVRGTRGRRRWVLP